MKLSVTITGLVVGVIAWISRDAGVPIAEGNIESFVQTALALISVATVYYGRFRQGDINIFGAKKDKEV